MSRSVAGGPHPAGRRAAPLTTAAYSAAEWDLLTGLPGRVLVAAARPATTDPMRSATADPTRPATSHPTRGVAAGLAGVDAVAAGRASDSDLVRAVVAAIYSRHDGACSGHEDACSGHDGAHSGRDEVSSRLDGTSAPAVDLVDLLAACRAAVRVLRRRADPADSAAYRQWVQSVAARVCRVTPEGAPAPADAPVAPADRRFLDRLGAALDLG
ncbi:hypothetical protein [Micromonospora okii]|uniref:hypothetical protein n=1 Tax=Micromonospora okii TaxID=1182970 RepID=UPI001E563364|nr:hypothetical protein [Micromonospora okii]